MKYIFFFIINLILSIYALVYFLDIFDIINSGAANILLFFVMCVIHNYIFIILFILLLSVISLFFIWLNFFSSIERIGEYENQLIYLEDEDFDAYDHDSICNKNPFYNSCIFIFWNVWKIFNIIPESTNKNKIIDNNYDNIWVKKTNDNIKNFSLTVFFFIFIFSFFINCIFNVLGNDDFFYIKIVEQFTFLYNLDFVFALDKISLMFITLTALVFFLAYLSIFFKKDLDFNFFGFTVTLFILEFLLILLFSTVNLFFFYMFFEALLIPLVLFINIWGSRYRKFHASFQLFFFTLIGSVFLILAIFILFVNFKTVDIRILTKETIDLKLQVILFILLFCGFAVKIPILPFHIWLPEAHVEAQTAGSIILAAVLLKIGAYGFFRFLIPLTSGVITLFWAVICIFCLLSMIISSVVAFRQTDMKKIIAYSSIAHMNIIVLSLMSMNLNAILGGFSYMITHAFTSTALFFCIGILYDRYGTRDLMNFSGLFYKYPLFSFFFFIFNLSNAGFPFFYSFVAELISLINLNVSNLFVVFISLITVFFSVVYSFWLLHNILYNKVDKSFVVSLTKKEIMALSILFLLVLGGNFFSNFFIKNLDTNILFYLQLYIK